MAVKGQYKTKHRGELLEYLETVAGKHITVNEICDYFKEKGSPIGVATVYRQLEKMVNEGLVSKYVIDPNGPACFEYNPADGTEVERECCYHCKCEKCGKLIHLHCDEMEEIQQHLMEHHQFRLNAIRTVFYGICEQCNTRTEQCNTRAEQCNNDSHCCSKD